MLRKLAIAAVMTMVAGAANAQSFNCKYAKAPDEVAICHSPFLAAEDSEMANSYFSLRQYLLAKGWTDGILPLEGGQRQWLKDRSQCGTDFHCLSQSYLSRLQDLTTTRQWAENNVYGSASFCRLHAEDPGCRS